jgi:hypothetical protein
MLLFGITYCHPNETPTLLMLLEGVARRLDQAGALLCVCSGSMVAALMLSSLISTALVSEVAPHPPSQT